MAARQSSIQKIQVNVERYEDTREMLIEHAGNTLRTFQAAGKFPETFITAIDGKVGKSLADVKKRTGKIEFIAPRAFRPIAEMAFEQLRKLSPIGQGWQADRTGRYHRAHALFWNGQPVKDLTQLEQLMSQASGEKRDQLWIVNTQPYARKIERGLSSQAPKGVYKKLASALRRRFGKIAFIDHKMFKHHQIGVRNIQVMRRVGTRAGLPTAVDHVYPGIQITRGRGVI